MVNNLIEQMYENVLNEVNDLVKENKIQQAKEKLENYVESFRDSNLYCETENTTYKYFYSPFEKDLYQYYLKPTKKVDAPMIDMTNLYLAYGSILLELKEVGEAQYYLGKAVYYNPVNAATNFEYIETYRYNNDMETFYSKTKDFAKFCYKKDDFSRILRNFGYYFIEQGIYDVAYSCYMLSMVVNGKENEKAIQELNYIDQNYDGEIPTASEGIKLLKEYDIDFNICPETITLAIENYKHYYMEGNKEASLYYLQVYYQMTGDEEALEQINELKEELQ